MKSNQALVSVIRIVAQVMSIMYIDIYIYNKILCQPPAQQEPDPSNPCCERFSCMALASCLRDANAP